MSKHQAEIDAFISSISINQSHEAEFLQAIKEVATAVIPYLSDKPKYKGAKILERMVIPERVIVFSVPWLDDKGNIQINKGFRVEFNSAVGPYKGGLRFHPSVNLSILKFLGFEQVFKNALTTLPMGGGKGGADFDPKGKSDREVMKFCQSFMTEFQKHIDSDTDIRARDIGVGEREIGYLFGQYKRLKKEVSKARNCENSLIRPKATGYGAVYFAKEMLATKNNDFHGKTVVISGSGNVAQYAAEKIIHLGGKVVTLSDSSGYVHVPKGIDSEQLAFLMELKNIRRGRIKELADKFEGITFIERKKPWNIKCDIALPCATQNELNEEEAKMLLVNGCICVAEGANMPSTPGAIAVFTKAKTLFSPGKASNAGGIAILELEANPHSLKPTWSANEMDEKLHSIMIAIHESCVKYGKSGDFVDYVKGANIAGFVKIADAMINQGLV